MSDELRKAQDAARAIQSDIDALGVGKPAARAAMPNLVLVTYPHGPSLVAETKSWEDGDLWIRGHGAATQLIEQQGCTITPLVAMTPARVAALKYVADLLGDLAEGQEDATHLAALDAMLAPSRSATAAGQAVEGGA